MMFDAGETCAFRAADGYEVWIWQGDLRPDMYPSEDERYDGYERACEAAARRLSGLEVRKLRA